MQDLTRNILQENPDTILKDLEKLLLDKLSHQNFIYDHLRPS